MIHLWSGSLFEIDGGETDRQRGESNGTTRWVGLRIISARRIKGMI